jgi:hypothetical protein
MSNAHSLPLQNEHLIDRLLGIMTRCGISYSEVGTACSASPSTIRACTLTRTLPAREDARLKLARFVAANETATSRTEVRFA